MENYIYLVNQIIAGLTLAGQAIIGLVFLSLIFRGKNSGPVKIIETYGLLIVSVISLGATLVSLFYSNFANFPPCDLCWWQRIFMYSIAVISVMALIKKDEKIIDYILGLAVFGFMIAAYNSYLQYGGAPLIPCGVDVGSVSCVQRFVFEYNYITIPLMSFTGFLMIIIVLAIQKFKKR